MNFFSLFLAFGAGVLTFFSPCVLPLIPSYILYAAGITFKDFSERSNAIQVRKQTIIHSLFFVLGFSLIFVSLGAAVTLIGQFVFGFREIIRILGGIVLILLGLYIMDILKLPFLNVEAKMRLDNKPAGYLGSFLVGITFAAAWVPCVGPILGSILVMASVEKTVLAGIILLAAYSLGLGLPFLLTALFLNSALVYFKGLSKYMHAIKVISGIFVVIIGILALRGSL
ncbi:MAG: cytochrome c biogenesis protein CcdA [Candidatus Saganbacteria bacterium]|nr:cytochrome c biogenesis protein CcdA [Candidatus Saganbacteria bacterium]